jgi:hypothetical protein
MDFGEPEEPDAGDESSVRPRLARLAIVGAGDDSRSSSTTGSASPRVPPLSWTTDASVVAVDFSFRDGGRGRGIDLREEANKSVSVGIPCLSGVASTGRPLASPNPLVAATRRGGVFGGEVSVGGVEGRGDTPEAASACGSVLVFLERRVLGDASDGGVNGRGRLSARVGDGCVGGKLGVDAGGGGMRSSD